MALRTDTFDLGALRLSAGEGRRLDLERRDRPVRARRRDLPGASRSSCPCGSTSRARPATATRCGCASTATLTGPCMRCLEPAEPTYSVDAREVSQPGETDELDSPYVERGRARPAPLGRDALALALPAKLLCRPDCAGLCPVCGDRPERRRSRAPPRARARSALGEARQSSGSTPERRGPDDRGRRRVRDRRASRSPRRFPVALLASWRDGRTQAEAVTRPNHAASLAAQDQRAGVQRVPAVPQPPTATPGVPGVRELQGPRDSRRHRRASRLTARRWSRSPWTQAGRISAPAKSLQAQRARPLTGIGVLLFGPAAEIGSVPERCRGGRRAGLDREGRRSRVRRALDAGGLDRAGRAGGRRGPRRRARLRRLDGLGARGRPVQHAPRPRHLPPRAGAPGADARRRRRCCCSTSARTSPAAPSTSSSSRTWARRSRRR